MRVHRTAQPYMKMYIFNCFSFFFHCCNVEISWWKYFFFCKEYRARLYVQEAIDECIEMWRRIRKKCSKRIVK